MATNGGEEEHLNVLGALVSKLPFSIRGEWDGPLLCHHSQRPRGGSPRESLKRGHVAFRGSLNKAPEPETRQHRGVSRQIIPKVGPGSLEEHTKSWAGRKVNSLKVATYTPSLRPFTAQPRIRKDTSTTCVLGLQCIFFSTCVLENLYSKRSVHCTPVKSHREIKAEIWRWL